MKRTLLCGAATLILAACGGSTPSDAWENPNIELVQPEADSTLNGEIAFHARATGDGLKIASFEITEPELPGADVTYDDATHSATLTATLRTLQFADGPLTVSFRAIDGRGGESVRRWSFTIDSDARVITLDDGYPSYRSEAGMTVSTTGGIADVGGFVYASTEKVPAHQHVHKIVTRTGWPDDSRPTVANLEGANDHNTPLLRLTVPHGSGDPEIASAKATVTAPQLAPVTVELLPASASPTGTRAYLLPLSSASAYFPFLRALTGDTELRITAEVTDSVGHTWELNGGSFTVTFHPLPPPVVVTVDTGYEAAAEAASVFAYRLVNDTYKTLFSSAHGERISHVVVTNPGDQPVSLGASIGDANTWHLSERWEGYAAGSSTRTVREVTNASNCCMQLPPPEGTRPCPGSAGCGASAPEPVTYTWDGSLSVTAYANGAAAPQTSSHRFVVPAASGSAAGRLDLYVSRSYVPRGSGPSLDTWDAAQKSYTRSSGSVWRRTSSSSTTEPCCYGSATYTTVTEIWTLTNWREKVASAVEAIEGSLAVSSQAMLAGGAEYGPAQPVSITALPESIPH